MTGRPRITGPTARVLAALLTAPEADWYGLQLIDLTGLASGSLYPILARLRGAGWLEARWEDIDPTEADRPARRYYRFTTEGLAQARAALDTYRGPARR